MSNYISKYVNPKNGIISGLLILGGIFAFNSYKKKKFKQISLQIIANKKLTKQEKADSLTSMDALDPNMINDLKGYNTYSDLQISRTAKPISDYVQWWNTDESGIIETIKSDVKSKYFMALVSKKFEELKGLKLSYVIERDFNDKEKAELSDYLDSLPKN